MAVLDHTPRSEALHHAMSDAAPVKVSVIGYFSESRPLKFSGLLPAPSTHGAPRLLLRGGDLHAINV
ncbi:hypothetical protein E2C01_038273 [Portunus trituberculatus]|uniref:Uncharacterized protein n=1 Tax=Portunus trituberculatus TaxID=210409 RepID=A0A5B7FGU1_PORTR|nr:hypothetical protein [Portunus trituberculatus]